MQHCALRFASRRKGEGEIKREKARRQIYIIYRELIRTRLRPRTKECGCWNYLQTARVLLKIVFFVGIDALFMRAGPFRWR